VIPNPLGKQTARLAALEAKVDRVSLLLEDWHHNEVHKKSCPQTRQLAKEMFLNTVLGGVLGYFLFRVLDLHFGHLFQNIKR
jgi:hypothetical protein